jgi:hypothetical protein
MGIFSNKNNDIQVVASIPANNLSWNREAILVWVPKAKGSLKVIYGSTSDGYLKSFLLLNDIPLVKWHDNEHNCPTCEKYLTAGYGIDKIDGSVIENIKSSSNKTEIVAKKDITPIKHLLELLDEGLYLVSFIPHYPTNGEGDFFWNMSNDMKIYRGLSDSWFSNGTPAFLLPTQPTNKYDEGRVEFYREQIRQGVQLGGIVYYFGGYLSAILDGHHRATASFAEGVPLNCLTICKVDGIYHNGAGFNKQASGLLMAGQTIDSSILPQDIIKAVDKSYNHKVNNQLSAAETDRLLSMVTEGWSSNISMDSYLNKSNRFPTYKGIEAIDKAGDLSDERIEYLLKEAKQHEEEDMEYVFQALIALGDNRTPRVAKAIASSERWISLWVEAFEFLADIRTQEIEDFFVDYLINDDKKRPEITKIIDDYFRV